ncbi:putative ABC transporter ATP-binding protein YjkB [Halolactibacillus miurensis]|uniref:ABC transporter ATP-binding protein YjkB n=2 Tax=Bacillaceae TaxID=186817 RepID=A0A1I6R328_9BACI|nr:phosphate ABC transporter ATP-binding protein [Halolactibacillus miurensis]GEM03618.1 putative ABC transporter ATP-binding protein YjkB [Halolactibacillus miurensis]SFS59093.1 putative ABC transport system ATP-binding protein [Halolactibacillus miurensis]
MTMTQTALTLDHVSFHIDDVAIIKDISGTIEAGKITAFVGPSGAGKSTLFRLINQLKTHTKGTITFNNEDVKTIHPMILRKNIGIVLQEGVMTPGTVYDNLALPRQLQNDTLSEDDALSFLLKVGLEERFLHKKAKELSGGQKQKVSIARTLVNQPEVLLMDEITSSLDQVSTQAIETLIKQLNKEDHQTILWITHNIDQAKRLSDNTWVLIDGKCRYQGPTNQLDEATDQRVIDFLEGGDQS